MEIPQKSPLSSVPVRNLSADVSSNVAAESSTVPPSSGREDTVRLTRGGRQFKAAVQNAQSIPDIREARVMQIKQLLEAGDYHVEKDRIAANMIDESLENNQALNHIDPTS